MGFFDSVKERISLNLKVTKLSLMTQPSDILQYCQAFTPDERSLALKNIENQFKWQPMAQMAHAMYPAFWGSQGGVSPEAMDLVQGGYVDAGVKLMGMQNQAPQAPNFGMLPIQQSALSFAWVVLKAIQQRDAASSFSYAAGTARNSGAPQPSSLCSSCGSRHGPGAQFCSTCGRGL